MVKFLIIQTAFIGDVILATALIEKLHQYYPDAKIDFLLRKGNEGLLEGHPYIGKVFIWEKKKSKYRNLIRISNELRKERYDRIINIHRSLSTGFVAFRSRAKSIAGFDKNPFSFCYSRKAKHEIGNGKHEIARNQELISDITESLAGKPCLYPSARDFEKIKPYKSRAYLCISPASIWFTKEYPLDKWADFINRLEFDIKFFLMGAPGDKHACEKLAGMCREKKVVNLAGELSFLESVALMKDAHMNYTNDSAPMHMASAVNAPITCVFCSTVPAYGFGPLSDDSQIVEIEEKLSCRPCGLHGHKTCPEQHFKCAFGIDTNQLLLSIKEKLPDND